MYDVVTTSVYPHVNYHTGLSKVDRTLALNLNKDKSYPLLKTFLQFGADTCHVAKPHVVIDRIATSMTKTLLTHREKIDGKFFELISTEWDVGRMSLEPTRVFMTSLVGDAKFKTTGTNFVSKGNYSGAILQVVNEVVVQKIGRAPDEVVRHDSSKLSRLPEKDEVVDIKYRDGVGAVSEKAVKIER